ncbi:MAG: enoyl-CoA hydratase/isomerase family protein [Hyphomicrobiales bacterium]
MTEDLLVWQDGRIGRLKLNRPKALNALTSAMALGIRDALHDWRDDDSISAVVIEGEGNRAFCAGGDILHLYNIGRDTPQIGVDFWREEYRLNAMIARYPKPYISIMDGVTMGGGVGVSAHARYRIVTERAMVAMPEASIGFLPDVGGSFLLSRAPGHSGLYLGMTGARMGAADAIFAGFADSFVPSSRLGTMLDMMRDGEDVDVCIDVHSDAAPDGCLEQQQHLISKAFDQPSAADCARCLEKLSNDGNEWASKTLTFLRKNAPLSVASTFYAIREASCLDTLEECLALEYRFAAGVLYRSDFYEGVRAVVLDKGYKPNWRPARLEDVTKQMVASAFASLGDFEWSFS